MIQACFITIAGAEGLAPPVLVLETSSFLLTDAPKNSWFWSPALAGLPLTDTPLQIKRSSFWLLYEACVFRSYRKIF